MSSFTPQQIEDFLQEFFDVVGARQYVGARYVPIFGRAGEDTVEWDDGAPYEPLTVVMHEGVSYVSRRYVPRGIQVTDTAYWVETYRFNAQVEQYRQEVLSFQGQIDQVREDMESDYVPFPISTAYPKYGTTGQVLTTLADGHTRWEDPIVPSDAQAEEVITEWLDAHPEATTTVEDGSVTDAKLYPDGILARVGESARLARPCDLNDYTANGRYIYLNESGDQYANKPTFFGSSLRAGYLYVFDIGSYGCQVLYNNIATSAAVGDANIAIRLFSYDSATNTYNFNSWKPLANASMEIDSSVTDLNTERLSRSFWISYDISAPVSNVPANRNSTSTVLAYVNVISSSPFTASVVQTYYVPATNEIFIRAFVSNAWTSWKPLSDTAFLLRPYTTDIDTVFTHGNYVLVTNTGDRFPNLPVGYQGASLLEVFNASSFIVQKLTNLDNGRIWVRTSSGTTWNVWKEPYATDITNTEKRINEHILSLDLPAIFHTIGVVGDSLASGQGRIDDYTHYHDFYDFSWPQCMARQYGNTVYNFTKSGLNTRTWLTNAMGWPLASDGSHAAVCYIIGLGANDVALGASYVGSSADINLNDYTQNADTYYGNYARIISMLRTLEPRSYIFVCTNPVYGSDAEVRAALNEAVRYMPTIFDRVYLIENDVSDFTGNSFISRNEVRSHYTPAAYKYIANYIGSKMSEIIYANPEDFYWVNLVGTQYADPS